MRLYSDKISITTNSRGVSSIDTIIGCTSGTAANKKGCYGDCYAAKSAKLYGYDFTKSVLRHFKSTEHENEIKRKINRVELDFIRVGTSGDPSENWAHTLSVLKRIDKCNKHIVIITKHWTKLDFEQLEYLSKINVSFNTSISALDSIENIEHCIKQYRLLKNYCKSFLRIVSCNFNLDNKIGFALNILQESLFQYEDIIDTIFRPNKNNPLVKEGVINTEQANFLGKRALVSKRNKSTYFGKCSTCHEMCGANMKIENAQYPEREGKTKQLKLFKSKK